MVQNRDKRDCCGCGACADICETKALRMVPDSEGFCYPRIDSALCTGCGRCESVCPMDAGPGGETDRLYYGAQARVKALRASGSSGGVFSILAEYALGQGGIVYGAGYDNDMNVIHKGIEDREQLVQIKRTKYVQSDMSGIYAAIERHLEEGRFVLFCGTPCQTRALGLFLGKAYEKLLLADLVCYGVPSPGIWKDYVKFLERKHRGKVTDFSFRDKRNVDNGHMCSYIAGGKEYAGSLYQNPFCKLYFKNLILRQSCHNCRFCTVARDSDFTIGDFWGIGRVRPEMDDGLGTSMVIVHTEKAKRVWEHIKGEMVWFQCGREDLLQPRLLEPAKAANGRKCFMGLYGILSKRGMINWIGKKIVRNM